MKTAKRMFANVMTIGLLAGAAALVMPAKAQAQNFAVGVQFGAPVYAPYYYNAYDRQRRDYYERLRIEREREECARREAWLRHEQFEQHERWEHARDYRDYDRYRHDRDDYDRR